MKTAQALIDSVSEKRHLEWWCVLNCKKLPAEIPRDQADEVFALLNRKTSKHERLGLWNGEFGGGLNVNNYINP